MKDKKAFTLAETMIVLVILGIVAGITIPVVVRRQIEAQNRTRIKKAMTVYDTAINKMVVENGIKNNDALINEFNADKNNNSCAKSRAYFKTSQDGANDCTFRASDGVWWNISDINHPIIAFNEDDLTDEIASGDTNKAFKLVGYLDNNGILRVSDLAKATDDNQEYLTKLYNFINNKKKSSGGTEEKPQKSTLADRCKSGEINCTKKSLEYTEVTQFSWGDELCIWDSETNKQTCPYTSTASTGDYYFTEPVTYENYQSYIDPEECDEWGNDNYYNAAKRYCDEKGGRLPTAAELISGGYTSSDFWAAEEYNSERAYILSSGQVSDGDKNNWYSYDVVCIGN